MIHRRAGRLRGGLLTLLTGACLLGTMPAHAAIAGGPISLDGSLGRAPYSIRVPARWNGTLILYSHGYVIPGQPNPAPDVANTPAGEWLAAHGYALAASAYSSTGWAVREGEHDGMALLAYFAAHVGRPSRTIAWGHSLGGLITANLVQRYPGSFAGALPMCGVLGGSVGAWNLQLDAAFAFKTLLAPRLPLAVVGIRSPLLNLVTAGRALTAAQRTAAGRARLSLVAALSGVPGWYDPSAPAPTDQATRERAQYQWLSTIDLPFFFALRADIEARAGGNPSWNTGVDYAAQLAASSQRAEVRALYRQAGLSLDADLGTLRAAPRIAANAKAVRYLRRYTIFDGSLGLPVLTLHTTGDGLVPVSDERAYASVVGAAGHAALLRQAYIARAGHCTFTDAEMLAAFQALLHRLDTGRWDGVAEPAALERRARALQANLTAEHLDPGAAPPAYIPFGPDPFPRPYDERTAP